MDVLGWAFEGIGAVVVGVGLTVALARASKSRSQQQTQRTTGANTTNIQAGRDVHVGAAQQDHERAVQPIMHLVLNSGEGGPEGHFLNGFIRNVGRGLARNTQLDLPGISDVPVDRLLKQAETFRLRLRYDNTAAFLAIVADPQVRVVFENEDGVRFEQTGTLEQSRGSHSDIYSYNINGLGPVRRYD